MAGVVKDSIGAGRRLEVLKSEDWTKKGVGGGEVLELQTSVVKEEERRWVVLWVLVGRELFV